MFRGKKLSLLAFLLLEVCATAEGGRWRIPFLEKKYTPLLFFKTPPGILPESDALEKTISEVEKELGVRVERMDVMRDPPSQALLNLLTSQDPPLLYNRESCQRISIPSSKSKSDEKKARKVAPIDKDRVIAWAKGRYLPPRREPTIQAKPAQNAPVVVDDDTTGTGQTDDLEDLSLSPLQKKGKQAIKERTEQAGKSQGET